MPKCKTGRKDYLTQSIIAFLEVKNFSFSLKHTSRLFRPLIVIEISKLIITEKKFDDDVGNFLFSSES